MELPLSLPGPFVFHSPELLYWPVVVTLVLELPVQLPRPFVFHSPELLYWPVVVTPGAGITALVTGTLCVPLSGVTVLAGSGDSRDWDYRSRYRDPLCSTLRSYCTGR
ncbi:hypothetical protein NDU88_013091 [Pleurodeles waltl]|uniref:Uncharacterized protein n=1 Tax=Pleurodeles waltl TaxID=8319 RepID=A0AAV7R7Q5_PLEWA|nr:hypothetical protein NDU88_013091 [Pleurodeles waltl]